MPLAIENALAELGIFDPEQVPILVSGDLTRCGAPDEFRVASSYLHDMPPPGRVPRWGIAQLGPVFEVPGNHDHWDGRMFSVAGKLAIQRAWNPAVFRSPIHPDGYFEAHPWTKPLASAAIRVEIHAIDTQSGFTATDTNLRARGAIATEQLEELDRLVEDTPADEGQCVVRVLLAHHPLEAAALATGLLDEHSLRELEARLVRHRFDAVLVGHAHSLRVRRLWLQNRPFPHRLLEFQAPTALQGGPEDSAHGFLVHELSSDPETGKATWRWQSWQWDASARRFTGDPFEAVDL